MMQRKPRFINVGGKLLDLQHPRVMGIVNVTPDSFYGGSRYTKDKDIIEVAGKMLDEGADILDVGGYSSRPGAEDISIEEEKRRVLKAVKLIRDEFPGSVISVDTFRSEVALQAVEESGADMINDISGGELDSNMFPAVSRLEVPYVMMHMMGTPQTMQNNPVYDDVVADILRWFGDRIFRLHSSGVKDIIIDPGFGFGKTATHNFELLRRLSEFSVAGLPVLVGISRKSMIWRTLEITPDEALNGTIALNAIAISNGADILRVHDVREAVDTIRLLEKIKING